MGDMSLVVFQTQWTLELDASLPIFCCIQVYGRTVHIGIVKYSQGDSHNQVQQELKNIFRNLPNLHIEHCRDSTLSRASVV